jgi:dimethylglycine dehydrogenase
MRSQARVVVIGGGVVGTNILYGLAKCGWKDALLLERRELTSGSTWHAAGLMSIYATGYAFSRLYQLAHEVYASAAAETGQAIGFHRCGTLRLASTRDRLDEYLHYKDIADSFGAKADIVGPAEVRRLWPLVEKVDDLVAALYHPDDGHAAPADVTQALAKGARMLGAEIQRQTEVTAISRTRAGEWRIATNAGDILCEHVVAATGSFARQTAAMVGLDIPVIPIVHQYLVTEEIPEITQRHQQGLPEMPILRDDTVQGYIREERQGLMFGPYDQDPPAYAVDGMPPDYAGELLPPDIDATLPYFERALARVPRLGEVGIRSCVAGPIAVSPDNRPLVGPAWGLENFWLAEGFTGGIAMGGGIGRCLAQWITGGEPEIDLHQLDPRRFGSYANKRYAVAKSKEAFANNFGINFPGWNWPAGRPAKTAPCYEMLKRRGAVFGVAYGWEVPNWFAPAGVEPKDLCSYRRSNYFAHVGRECHALREGVGLYDLTLSSKYEVVGVGAAAWLDGLLASRIPAEPGRASLCYLLTAAGRVECEFTVTRLGENRFYLVGPTVAERHHFDVLSRALPRDGSVTIENVTMRFGAFAVAGPKSRDLLAELVDGDLSNTAFPWWSARIHSVGPASEVRMLRFNYVGELGWELHHPIEYQNPLLEMLIETGRDLGLALVGARAVDSLRLEKSYRGFWRDLSPEFSALETGLDRFISLQKPSFRGRDALLRQGSEGPERRFAVLEIPSGEAEPYDGETVYRKGRIVGRITSGGYSHIIGKALAHAYVDIPLHAPGTALEISVLGKHCDARVIAPSPYDPANLRPRG